MISLLELRKYAIDHRVEIRFGAPTSQECLINNKGQVKIPGENKDFSVEEALQAAESFVVIGTGGAQNLTREAMARTIAEAMEGSGSGSHTEEDE